MNSTVILHIIFWVSFHEFIELKVDIKPKRKSVKKEAKPGERGRGAGETKKVFRQFDRKYSDNLII